ncbi:MAG TPA: hypothetical protein VNS34_12220 [Rhizobiaceae bacterium]|nr:hypothetical protein [Rhizobiaceae bacterium]
MLVKLPKGRGVYARRMFAALVRLLTIASFVLMPLAMSSAPAMAAEQEPMAASMPCEGHDQPSHTAPVGKMHCTACIAIAEPNAALPVAAVQPAPSLVDRDGRLLLGLGPEVATPPPKGV